MGDVTTGFTLNRSQPSKTAVHVTAAIAHA